MFEEKKIFELQKSQGQRLTTEGTNTVLAELKSIRLLLQQLFENRIKEVMTLEDAAKFLNADPLTIKRYALKTHELIYYKVGRDIVFKRQDLLAFLETRKIACYAKKKWRIRCCPG